MSKHNTAFDIAISAYVTDETTNRISEFSTWANDVKEAVKNANQDLYDTLEIYKGNTVPSLAGFYAEVHHAGSFNINAALKGSEEGVYAAHSTQAGSADIKTTWGEDYSSKYYKTAEETFKKQAERTQDELGNFTKLKYEGQQRIVPSDQLSDAEKFANQKIVKEISNRPEVAKDSQETKDHLTDRIKSPRGVESDPLSKKDADEWARNAKQGKVEEFKNPNEVSLGAHISEIGEAAATAALVSVAISSAPVVLGNLKRVYSDPNYKWNNYAEDLGHYLENKGPEVAADAFLKSAVAGSITAGIKSGALTGPFTDLSPGAVAGISVTAVESAKALWKWQKGEMTGEQAASESFKAGIKTCASLAGKAIGQTLIPVPVVGAVIGSMVASFIINKGIDKVENPLSMQLLEQIYFTFDSQKVILINLFEVNINYQEVYTSYNNLLVTNRIILFDQNEVQDSNRRIIENFSNQQKKNERIAESLKRNKNLLT